MFDICPNCFTRADACLDCYEKKLAAKDKEIARLRAALKGANEYIGELQDDRVGCHFCSAESMCFTCGLLLSASDTIHKALEGK